MRKCATSPPVRARTLSRRDISRLAAGLVLPQIALRKAIPRSKLCTHVRPPTPPADRALDTAVVPDQLLRPQVLPPWVDRVLVGFGIYVLAGAAWMLSGLG